MGTYAALAEVEFLVAGLLDYGDTAFSNQKDLQKTFETVHKRVQSFEVFMARLDSSSRARMKDSLVRVEEATRVFSEKLLHIYDEDFTEYCHSFIETLKKVEEEFVNQDTHLPDDEVVHSKSNMVGLSDEYTTLKKEIVGDWVDEIVFSLVGMAGIGKTALANKLFQDLDILEWFDCCAWVVIGRQYQPQEITQNILAQLGVDEHMLTEGYLRKCLANKRCFIVLDDVWDLEMVKNCLEISSRIKIKNGSRLLVTTRIQHQYSFPRHIINMRLLNKQESLNLLCDKVFAQNSCPLELEEAVKMIAEKCDGLPLTIVTVANLLSKTPRSQWIEVAEKKKHPVFIDAYDKISEVLYPSFDNIREDMKLCFIYMGVFPQNYKIRKSKLINLWIVEKIIHKRIFQTLEMSCVECLQYLAMHNLVMVYQRSSTPLDDLFEKIKTCGLHSSWWYFCYKEAKKNNFFHVLDSCTDASREVMMNQSRLTIHNNVLLGIKAVNKSVKENCVSTTHSLLCLGLYHQYPVPICFGLKLKKFDALHIRFYKFPLEVLKLVKLRYLAITCNGNLPSSISKLRKLQYLIVHRHLIMKVGAPSYLPIEIWDMKRLKYLQVMGSDLPDVSDTFLPKLLTLSDVSFNSCTSNVLGRTPNIKKLGIRVDLMPGAVEPSCCFDHISHLRELESFKYLVVNPTCNFEVIAPLVQLSTLPLNLKKLYLSGLGYPWKEMSTISSLPNLEVLKLRNNAFQGPLWKVENDKFPKLTFLQMEDINLEILEGRDSFKSLKKLSIQHCYNLRKLRFTMKDEFASNFEVVDCNPRIEKNIRNNLYKSDIIKSNLSAQFSFSWNS